MTDKEEIRELKEACMLLQGQISALRTLIADLEKRKEDKKRTVIQTGNIITLKKN